MQRRQLPAISHRRANPKLAVGYSSSPGASPWLSQTRRALSGRHGRSLFCAARRWVCRLTMMRTYGMNTSYEGHPPPLCKDHESPVACCRSGQDAGVGLRGRGHQARRRRLQESVRIADVGLKTARSESESGSRNRRHLYGHAGCSSRLWQTCSRSPCDCQQMQMQQLSVLRCKLAPHWRRLQWRTMSALLPRL